MLFSVPWFSALIPQIPLGRARVWQGLEAAFVSKIMVIHIKTTGRCKVIGGPAALLLAGPLHPSPFCIWRHSHRIWEKSNIEQDDSAHDYNVPAWEKSYASELKWVTGQCSEHFACSLLLLYLGESGERHFQSWLVAARSRCSTLGSFLSEVV